jgi:hypothetical protein
MVGYLGIGIFRSRVFRKVKNQSMKIFTKVKKNIRTDSTILFEQRGIN